VAGSTIYTVINGPAGTFRGQVIRHDANGNRDWVLYTTGVEKNLRTYQEALADVERWLRENNCHAVKE
jgi:hypothetical protein